MNRKRLVVLVVVLIELGLCAAMYSIVRATVAVMPGFTVSAGGQLKAMAEASEQRRIALDSPAKLTVDNLLGAVRIAAGGGDQMAVTVHKQVWAPTADEAQTALAGLKVETTQEGNTVHVQANAAVPATISPNVLRPAVDITVTVPATTTITSHVLWGGITISGTTGDIQLTSNRGPIRASNITGNLQVQSDSGDITADDIRGQVQIGSIAGALKLSHIRADGELSAKTIAGDILLEDCTASSIVLQMRRSTYRYSGNVTLNLINR